MNKNIMDRNAERILEVFYRDSQPRHIRELARLCRLSPNTVISAVKSLAKRGLILLEKKAVTVEARPAIENPEFIRGKMIYNIRQIYYSGIVDFLVDEYNHPDAVVLYGSYRRGENAAKSDIDIVVITGSDKNPDISLFEKKLGSKVHLSALSLKKASNEFLNNLINGLVLYGHLSIK